MLLAFADEANATSAGFAERALRNIWPGSLRLVAGRTVGRWMQGVLTPPAVIATIAPR
jgi:hypothetical protein